MSILLKMPKPSQGNTTEMLQGCCQASRNCHLFTFSIPNTVHCHLVASSKALWHHTYLLSTRIHPLLTSHQPQLICHCCQHSSHHNSPYCSYTPPPPLRPSHTPILATPYFNGMNCMALCWNSQGPLGMREKLIFVTLPWNKWIGTNAWGISRYIQCTYTKI